MDDYERRFRDYLQSRGIEAEWLGFETSCHSVAEAAASAGVSEQDVVKNICMIGANGQLVVAIARGDDRVSSKRVGRALEQAPPRIADPSEVLELTGYPAGGTPSFGYAAITLVDPRVMERAEVLTGGGSSRSLLRIRPQVLVEASDGQVVRVRR